MPVAVDDEGLRKMAREIESMSITDVRARFLRHERQRGASSRGGRYRGGKETSNEADTLLDRLGRRASVGPSQGENGGDSAREEDVVAEKTLLRSICRVAVAAVGAEDTARPERHLYDTFVDRAILRIIQTLRLSGSIRMQCVYIETLQALIDLSGLAIVSHFSELLPLLCSAAGRRSFGNERRYQAQLNALKALRLVLRACPIPSVVRRHRKKFVLAASHAFYSFGEEEKGEENEVRNMSIGLCCDVDTVLRGEERMVPSTHVSSSTEGDQTKDEETDAPFVRRALVAANLVEMVRRLDIASTGRSEISCS